MRSTISRRRTLAVLLGGALAGAVLPLHQAAASDPAVTVTSTATGTSLSTDTVPAGQIDFTYRSTVPATDMGGGSDIAILQRHNNVTLAQVVARIRAEMTGPGAPQQALDAAAAATRWLADTANVTIYGGASVSGVGAAHTVTTLGPGTYQLLNLSVVFATPTGAVAATPLHVTGRIHPALAPRISSTIDTTSADRFSVTSTHLVTNGKYLIRNTSDTIHFVNFAPVKPGTTDADITALLAPGSMGPDPFLHDKVAVGSEVMSPGMSQVFSSALLTPGTYDLECFVADDMTGLPHFFMGMHKIVKVGNGGVMTPLP